jgi:hypothetical protein
MKTPFISITGFILACGILFAVEQQHSYKPKEGFVPDEKTAIAIAVAVWSPIYGVEKIQMEKPFETVLKNGVWHVEGALPAGNTKGGVAEAEISKKDARILRVSHGQ